MKIHVLSEDRMRDIGFTDHKEGYWHYCRNLGNEITFNLSVKKDGTDYKIDVMDEDFGQPYDYQYYLLEDPNFKFALKIKEKVDTIIWALMGLGIVSDYRLGDYI